MLVNLSISPGLCVSFGIRFSVRRSQLLCLGAANSSVRSEREGRREGRRVGENRGNEVEDLYY